MQNIEIEIPTFIVIKINIFLENLIKFLENEYDELPNVFLHLYLVVNCISI